MKTQALQYFACPWCKNPGLGLRVFESLGDEIVHGLVHCRPCRTWYPIEDRLPFLLPLSLQEPERLQAFEKRFRSSWDGWAASANATGRLSEKPGDAHKKEQRAFYQEDSLPYETSMLQLQFWKTVDACFIEDAERWTAGRGLLIEIGGGTGRMSLPMSSTFDTILSFDISDAMVRTAMAKRDRQGVPADRAHYFVGDAESIPVRDGIADLALMYGILHHVESPDAVIRESMRSLKVGGTVLGSENNRSAFRPVFDVLMRVAKLWNEKAHEEHYILSGDELSAWLRSAGGDGRVWTSVFLPPHVFNHLGPVAARRLLRVTDGLCGRLPWLRRQGGLVLFSGSKR